MNVLVTGCGGFIGSHVAEKLLENGNKVIGVDNVNDYYSVDQKKNNLDILKNYDSFTFHKEDISDSEAMRKIFNESDFTDIAHLAARAGVRSSIENPLLYSKSNFMGANVLLELARKNNIENFVLTSSSSVYGNTKDIPFNEEQRTGKPVSPYAATKKSTEVLAYTYHYLHDMNINVIRPFTIYGPRGRPDMAPYMFMKRTIKGKLIKKFGDGTTKRDYTYIDDFVDGFLNAIKKKFGYEIFNLGNNDPITLNKFISTIEEVVGKKANVKQVEQPKADVDITYANISKAQDKLNYDPKTDIKSGLKELYSWMIEKKNLK